MQINRYSALSGLRLYYNLCTTEYDGNSLINVSDHDMHLSQTFLRRVLQLNCNQNHRNRQKNYNRKLSKSTGFNVWLCIS